MTAKKEISRSILFRGEIVEITYDDGSIVTGINCTGEKEAIPTDAVIALGDMCRSLADGQRERGQFVPLNTGVEP